ncbi:hypothetical protein Patl1_14036 [Pistacia atlantica]|uniref:Uncharacterized protein n=1 Tax=Pistacia atlantica TaxID=434234 RepID=A0ACC1AYF1_9ROSI|nr:hypothetical protein Patl1_14036 [Pistacia atlantica]
MGALEINGVT